MINKDIIRNNKIIFTTMIIFVFVSMLYWIAVNSDNIRAIPTFITIVLAIFLGLLIVWNSSQPANIFFSLSSFILALSLFLALIAYIDDSYEFLFTFASPILMIFPLGMYISSKIVLNGKNKWLDHSLIIIISFIGLLAFIFMKLRNESKIDYFNEILIADLSLSILLVLLIYQFLQIKERTLGITTHINLLIFGYIISLVGLLGNIVLVSISPDQSGSIIRQILPMFGILFVVLIFSLIPQEKTIIQNKKYHELKNFYLFLDEAVLNLGDQKIDESSSDSLKNEAKEKAKDYQNVLNNDVNGTSLAILIEAASSFPNGISNTKMRNTLNKNKTTITRYISKLLKLGFLKQIQDLTDVRLKPYILTEQGAEFLFHLHNEINSYVLDKNLLFNITNSIRQTD